MPVFNNVLAGAAGQAGGADAYKIERSLRFNSADSAYLNRTPSSAGNRKTWTWSGWVKRSGIASGQVLFMSEISFNEFAQLSFNSSDQLQSYLDDDGSGGQIVNATSAVFRDVSAWYHVVWAVDSTNATASDRVKLYVNGVDQSYTGGNIPQNGSYPINSTTAHSIGIRLYNNSDKLNSYLADVHFIDGQALAETDFGEFDNNGVWQPIKYTGDYNYAATDYESLLTAPGGFASGEGADKAFDGSTSTRTKASTADDIITFDLSSLNLTGSFEFWATNASSQYSLDGGTTWSSSVSSNWTTATNDISGVSNIKLKPSSGTTLKVTAFRNQGTVLVSGTSGVNGFHLDFSDTSSNAALGLDQREGVTQNPTGTSYGSPTTGGTINNVFDGSVSTELEIRPDGSGITLGTAVTATSSVRIYGSSERTSVARYQINGTNTSATPETYPTRGWTNISGLTFPITINSFGIGGAQSNDGARLNAIEIDGAILTGTANNWTVNNLVATGPQDGISATAPQGSGGDWAGVVGFTPSNTNGAVATLPDGGGQDNTNGRFSWSGLSVGDTITLHLTTSDTSNRSVFGDVDESTTGSSPGSSLGTITLTASAASGSAKVDFNGTANIYGITPGPLAGRFVDDGIDSPTNYEADSGNNGGNYCVMNPLDMKSNVATQNGNLEVSNASAGWSGIRGTLGVSSGKWYYELTTETASIFAGIATAGVDIYANAPQDSTSVLDDGALVYCDDGKYLLDQGGSSNRQTYGTALANGDILGVAFDLDGNTVQFYKNGSALGSINISSSPLASNTVFPYYISYYTSTSTYFNFGQRPFAYTPPTGYKSLCTANLDDPLIADGSTAFDATIWSGDGVSGRDITTNHSPDLVWIKRRNSSNDWNILFDSIRGGEQLSSNEDDEGLAQGSNVAGYVSAYNSDGFRLTQGSNLNSVNATGGSYVGWTWDAGDLVTTSDTTNYNQSQTWSDLVTGTIDSTYGSPHASAPFDSDTGSSYSHGITPTSGNYLSMNFGTTFANATSVKIYGYASLDGATYTGANENLKINGTAIGASAWTSSGQSSATFSLSSGLTSLEWGYSSGSQSTGYLYLSGIEVDGKLLINPGVIPAGGLNSSVYNQDSTWSTNSGVGTPANAFDGNLSTGGTVNSSGNDVTVTTASFTGRKIRFYKNGNNQGTTYLNVNSTQYSFPSSTTAEGWVEVDLGSATNVTTLTTSWSPGAYTLYAVEVDGKILVDNGVTVSNVPSIPSTVRANPTAGFSIVTFNSGSAGQKTIGHGLGAAPEFIISKDRSNTAPWVIYHKSLGTTSDYLIFDDTDANTASNIWGSTAPSSTVFGFDSGSNSYANADVLALCFAAVEGYSAFGQYIGNGLIDGPFVYTGFRPRFILQKSTANEAYGSWHIYDTARDPINGVDNELYPNDSLTEGSIPSGDLDILSNGFKMRTGFAGGWNTSNTTYIYAAFAENPFKYARAR